MYKRALSILPDLDDDQDVTHRREVRNTVTSSRLPTSTVLSDIRSTNGLVTFTAVSTYTYGSEVHWRTENELAETIES